MLNKFEKKVLDFIRSEGLLDSRQAVLAAVSGGADSMALLTVLKRLAEEDAIDRLPVVGHVNHRLRGAAGDADEAFVKDAAARWGIACLARAVNVRDHAQAEHLSTETAARKLRLNALIDMAAESQCGAVATAHHMDDNVETVIHRLLRGTGLRGLAGIRPLRTLKGEARAMTFISPLLCAARAEILAYCADTKIEWRHDHTNDEHAYTRNRIRHLLLPALQRVAGSDLPQLVNRLSARCRSMAWQLEQKVDDLYAQAVRQDEALILLDRQILASQVDFVAVELIRRALLAANVGLRDMSEGRYRMILRQARTGSPRRVSLPGAALVSLHKDRLRFEKVRRTAGNAPAPEGRPLVIGGRTPFGSVTIETALLNAQECDLRAFKSAKDRCTEWFDYDRLSGPLVVRGRRPGDRFHPFGMSGEKKVGKFLSAAGVDDRRQIAIIADSEKIIWVAPLRPCEQTRITAETRTVLRMTLEPWRPDPQA